MFQSENNLDIKIEITISNIVFLNIAKAVRQEPPEYEPILRQYLPDYDKYDSIVLLWYQPWEGTTGARGYAMVKGICNPQLSEYSVRCSKNSCQEYLNRNYVFTSIPKCCILSRA